MRRVGGFVVVLVVGLATLSLAGYFVLTSTTREWFANDLALRSSLAVAAAQGSIEQSFATDPVRLRAILTNIARDERIMGSAACGIDGRLVASTEGYPLEFPCSSVVARMRQSVGIGGRPWSTTVALPGGSAHLHAEAVGPRDAPFGVVVLVHDLRFLDLREATTRRMLGTAFFVLALCASLFTMLLVRFAWRGWTQELRQALSGGATGLFEPLIRDVMSLAERLSRERGRDAREGEWSARRLRSTLQRYLQGERVVILANREPYVHERTNGEVEVLHPASGLVTALEPVLRACSGVWVAHGSGSADRDTVDRGDHVAVPPGEESYVLRRVWLSEEEENGYYYGFSNEGLWPLCHVADTRPVFRASDWEHYVRVNRKFAEAVCEEVDTDDPIVLVQDYHFALAPRMIRERLPRATIIVFWHIPWPSAERIGICPYREEVIAGLLGASVVGFHTQQHCNSFLESVDAFMESRIDREANAVVLGGNRTLVRAYPISIEWPIRWLGQVPPVAEARESVRRELGLPEDALLGVGVDRLDYTKGIEERILAVDELLMNHPELRGKFTFVQLGAPSRTKIGRYTELNERVEALVAEVNEKWASDGYVPVMLLRAHHEPVSVFRHYRAAEVCYVSSLHDGMNLVAKEFVAARDDEQGVLVLSQFTGAARELTEALVVNPYDLREASEALAAALTMSPEEQRERMRAMRRNVAEFNVYRWAGRMLVDAAELRRKERVSDRLGSTSSYPGTEAG